MFTSNESARTVEKEKQFEKVKKKQKGTHLESNRP
jgi:hypothetical protein